jgi:cyclophilin family peptidyl-prolyl cis-trans isomerase/HEAT repeat protein
MTKVNIDLEDPVLQKIKNHEYGQEVDSLKEYFSAENPTYRYLVAQSMATLQNKDMLDSLYTLLDDPVIKVRAMAAYAIGQTADPASEEVLLKAFRQKDTMSVDNISNAAILEALGKLGSDKLPELMIAAKGYRDTDTLLMRAKMKSLYRFALRGIQSEKVSSFLIEKLRSPQLDSIARLYAAHCLARTKDLDIEKIKFQIAELFTQEKDINVKMALALALRNTSDKEIQNILLDELQADNDPRVKINILKALSNYSYIESAQLVTELIKSDNHQLAQSACNFLFENGIKEDVPYYRQIARENLPWQIKASLYKSITKLLPYYYSKSLNAVRWEIQQEIKDEQDTLAIAQYVRAFSHDPSSYTWIMDFLEKTENPMLKTAGVETIGQIISQNGFDGFYKSYASFHRKSILEFLKLEMENGDEGVIAAAADIIARPESKLSNLIDSTDFLFELKSQLANPAQIESIHALDRAIAQVRGVNTVKYTPVKKPKSLDWSMLTEFTPGSEMIVKTDQGVFRVKLFFEEVPATVFNFMKLARENYFDDKIFHRVVPNFVAQTGSPRADNYGGMDYVISSELTDLYYDKESYLGMASAGKNTESCQWFITHSPTPHLDGKYTIFGEVIEGQEIIQQIKLGDKIQDIIITSI